jgi:hypothetical protein
LGLLTEDGSLLLGVTAKSAQELAEIFGNAGAAYAYGFVRSRDGAWQVRPNCRR